MSNDSFVFNTDASGQAQVNQGQNVTATQNNNIGAVPTVEQVFTKLAEAIPEESQAEVEERVFGPLREELNTLAATPIAEAELPDVKQSFMEKVSAIVTPFAGTPLASKLANAAIAVGETGLSLIPPPVGWAITLALAGIRALK